MLDDFWYVKADLQRGGLGMTASDRNTVAGPGRRTFGFGDLAFRTLVPSAFSAAVSVFEVELAEGCLSGPLHVHDKEDGISYVLEGCLTFQVGNEISTASVGEVVRMPRGVRHTFWNAGPAPASALDIVTPGGLENYYEELARIARASDVLDQLASMEARFGIHMDWESISTLTSQYDVRMAAS
jgi:quercetin dioxygenase-like cupin family protein